MSRPLVSAGMIAAELGISARAAQNLVAELGLREATGRGRYRAWGIREPSTRRSTPLSSRAIEWVAHGLSRASHALEVAATSPKQSMVADGR